MCIVQALIVSADMLVLENVHANKRKKFGKELWKCRMPQASVCLPPCQLNKVFVSISSAVRTVTKRPTRDRKAETITLPMKTQIQTQAPNMSN